MILWPWRAWQAVWDFEAPARTLDRVRIGVGVLFVLVFVTALPHARLLFDGELGVDPALIRSRLGGWRLDWFDHLSTGEVYGLLALGITAAALFAAGVVPRLTGAITWFVHLGLQYRCSTWMDGSDDLLRAFLVFLLFVPWSRGATTYPGWPLRLVQLQLAVMYLATAIWKTQGADWHHGTALYWALSDPRWQRFPTEWLVGTGTGQAALQLATWGTLGLEYALPVLLFWPRTRRLALALGVALHLGIQALMVVGLFTPAVLVGYLAFWDGRLALCYPWRNVWAARRSAPP